MKFVYVLALALVFAGCATQRGFPPEHQIVNFDYINPVSPELYRGAQPSQNGLAFLKSVGVSTVVNLRQLDDVFPAEEGVVKELGMAYISAPLSGVRAPAVAEINAILARIEAAPQPVFVHCQYGCDRTGLVIACWRIRHDRWSNDKALLEAEQYGLSPWLPNFKSFIKHFPAKP